MGTDPILINNGSPQVAAAAPLIDCPKCGRRMQLLSSSPTSYNYVCYAHSTQNSSGIEPYYLNLHKFTDENGRIKYANPRA